MITHQTPDFEAALARLAHETDGHNLVDMTLEWAPEYGSWMASISVDKQEFGVIEAGCCGGTAPEAISGAVDAWVAWKAEALAR